MHPGVIRVVLGAMVAAVLGAGCSDEKDRIVGPPVSDIPRLTTAQLLQAPDTLRADGVTFVTQPFLWRDFMNSRQGSPLMAQVRVNAAPPDTIPPSVASVYLWVIQGEEVWSTKVALGSTDSDGTRTYGAYDGPRWGPGIDVDVVVGVRTSPSEVALVLRRGIPILMTL